MYDPREIPPNHIVTPLDSKWEQVRYWDPVLRGYVSIRRRRIKSHLHRDID